MCAKQYHGKLYATSDMSKVVIVLTGSDGGHRWANDIAKALYSNGISSYALAYWGEKGWYLWHIKGGRVCFNRSQRIVRN